MTYTVGSQDTANGACEDFKEGAGTLVGGSTLCSNSTRKGIEVSVIYFSKFCNLANQIIVHRGIMHILLCITLNN